MRATSHNVYGPKQSLIFVDKVITVAVIMVFSVDYVRIPPISDLPFLLASTLVPWHTVSSTCFCIIIKMVS